ncbi:hypothetical protein EVAR_25263_1 [Eumeta japonica]|uniref:Uncharacterized protein n=1 Tax=Eumeta variegata TaxID=151549 RepID=A0A4C1VP25_EUMVA|nr:hypothetical protein EVAR_25263_1 [Eumeta japonica]
MEIDSSDGIKNEEWYSPAEVSLSTPQQQAGSTGEDHILAQCRRNAACTIVFDHLTPPPADIFFLLKRLARQ